MELIHLNSEMQEQRQLAHYSCDFEINKTDISTFELSRSLDFYNEIAAGDYIAVEGTEYGGMVMYVRVNTEQHKVYLDGRTWRGMLHSKIVSPPAGQDYYIVTNRILPAVIATLLQQANLLNIFRIGTIPAAPVQSYQFKRYCTLYEAITELFSFFGLGLQLDFINDKVHISAVSTGDEIDITDRDAHIDIIDNAGGVNHLICLGQGELSARQVAHLYKQPDGSISDTQYYTGAAEVVDKFENTNAATLAELVSTGTQHFEELLDGEIKRDLLYKQGHFKLGDKLVKADLFTGLECSTSISKIVFVIDKGYPYDTAQTKTDYS